MKLYFDESFRQLNTAITMSISTVIGPNNATINPTANVTTKVLGK
jgi:hypothetical protein